MNGCEDGANGQRGPPGHDESEEDGGNAKDAAEGRANGGDHQIPADDADAQGTGAFGRGAAFGEVALAGLAVEDDEPPRANQGHQQVERHHGRACDADDPLVEVGVHGEGHKQHGEGAGPAEKRQQAPENHHGDARPVAPAKDAHAHRDTPNPGAGEERGGAASDGLHDFTP